jgi:hypothetical protein
MLIDLVAFFSSRGTAGVNNTTTNPSIRGPQAYDSRPNSSSSQSSRRILQTCGEEVTSSRPASRSSAVHSSQSSRQAWDNLNFSDYGL